MCWCVLWCVLWCLWSVCDVCLVVVGVLWFGVVVFISWSDMRCVCYVVVYVVLCCCV